MSNNIALLFLTGCFGFLFSCSGFNPEPYRADIEDCLRFELSTKHFRELLQQYESMYINLGLRSKYAFSLSEYDQTLEYVNHAKQAHGKDRNYNYYDILDYLWLHMDAYESNERLIKKYRTIIESMKREYNAIKLDMTSFSKIHRNMYIITDLNSRTSCSIVNEGNNNISISVNFKSR